MGLAVAGLFALIAGGIALMSPRGEADVEEGGEGVDVGDVVVSPDPVPTTDSGAGIRVATSYRKAGEALRGGDYSRARELFAAVRDDPGVLEPTGTWAACEVVSASLLAGKSDQAREDASLAVKHVRSAEGLPKGIPEILEDVLSRLQKVRPIRPPEDFDGGVGPRYLGWWLSGLKNWEQGRPESALPFFEAVSSAPASGSNAWLAPYAKLAADYLADAERLAQAEPKSFDLDPEDYTPLIDELHALHTTLRTKGRARFNVRAWQLELEKRSRMSDGTGREVATGESASAYPEGLEGDLRSCRFGDAVAKLKAWQPTKAKDEGRQRAMLMLVEAATSFLAELGERAVGVDGPEVVCRDGRRFEGINGADPGRVRLRTATGSEVSVDWNEVEPDSLIAWHRELARGEASELERLRAHELAVAFDLLAGDAERGREAGSRLAEQSDAFRRRWNQLAPVLNR